MAQGRSQPSSHEHGLSPTAAGSEGADAIRDGNRLSSSPATRIWVRRPPVISEQLVLVGREPLDDDEASLWPSEVAARLGRSQQTILNWIHEGRIMASKRR